MASLISFLIQVANTVSKIVKTPYHNRHNQFNRSGLFRLSWWDLSFLPVLDSNLFTTSTEVQYSSEGLEANQTVREKNIQKTKNKTPATSLQRGSNQPMG